MRDGNAGDNGSQEHASERLELPMVALPESHPCQACGECCRYIATEIDAPTSMQDYEHIAWYLLHRDVSVYVDWEGDWYIEFRTVCENLTEEATCGIYRDRPQICSDFSWNECERTTKESASKHHFHRPEEFVEFLREKRPKAYAKYMKFRRKLIEKRSAQTARSETAKAPTDAAPEARA